MAKLTLSTEAVKFLLTVLSSVQLRASDPDLEQLAKVTAEAFRELSKAADEPKDE